MIKILSINKTTRNAEIEIPLELALPQYEINKKSALQRLKNDETTMKKIKALEKRGYAAALEKLLNEKLLAL